MLLAIDTSTSLVGAALHDGTRTVAQEVREDPRAHAELLAPLVTQILTASRCTVADLEAIVCGVGPGPFTGLRVGVVTALSLASTRPGLPVLGLCSLDALAHEMAQRAASPAELLVATDARRREVYAARYALRRWRAVRLDGPVVARAHDLPSSWRALTTVGRGPVLYPEALPHGIPDLLDVRPGALAEVAAAAITRQDPDGVLLPPEPLYLRRPDALRRANEGGGAP